MFDKHNRKIDYLRLSVTDKCNFRCLYCASEKEFNSLNNNDLLTYKEFLRIVHLFCQLGIKTVRITGGEPLIKKDIIDFIYKLSKINYIENLVMTTNGSLLPQYVNQLYQVGIKRLNISLNTFDKERYRIITGNCGELSNVLKGIEKALKIGFKAIKLNIVLTNMIQKDYLFKLIQYVKENFIHARFIEYMPMGSIPLIVNYTIEEIKKKIINIAKEQLVSISNIQGNGPANYYSFKNFKGSFGFISPISNHFCKTCNRIRLTADGKIKPCLLSNIEVDIKTPLRNKENDKFLIELIKEAIINKPKKHFLKINNMEKTSCSRSMFQIGG